MGSQKLMLAQNRLLRRNALGRFDHLLVQITANPAMLIWLSGTDNRKDAPNENYGRELMELFTLGEGNGYTEKDVREQARALTGWTSTWTRSKGMTNFRFDPTRHDPGQKTVFGKRGNFAWRDSSRSAFSTRSTRRSSSTSCGATSCPSHRMRGRGQAWSRSTSATSKCDPCSRRSFAIRRCTPARAWSSPPSVHRRAPAWARPRDRHHCVGVAGRGDGQRLFNPPNVAGWDDSRWLDTNTFHGRWWIANTALEKVSIGDRKGKKAPKVPNDPEAIVKGALAVLGNPTIRPETRRELLRFASTSLKSATGWKAEAYPPLVANAVRQLLAVSPDLQTC